MEENEKIDITFNSALIIGLVFGAGLGVIFGLMAKKLDIGIMIGPVFGVIIAYIVYIIKSKDSRNRRLLNLIALILIIAVIIGVSWIINNYLIL